LFFFLKDGSAVQLLETTRESTFMLLLNTGQMVLEPSFGIANYEVRNATWFYFVCVCVS